MPEHKKDESITKKMNVTFKSREEYQKFINGDTYSNKGIRNKKGRLSSQPDISLSMDEKNDIVKTTTNSIRDQYNIEDEKQTSTILEIIISGFIEGLGEAFIETLSDEEKRKIVYGKVYKLWNQKAIPKVKKAFHSLAYNINKKSDEVRSLLQGKTKCELLKETKVMKANSIVPKSTKQVKTKNESFYESIIDSEEAYQELEEIKLLAVLLANKIRKLSNTCIKQDNLSYEELIERQRLFQELATENVYNSIRLLTGNNIYELDESTLLILSAFLKGNLIVKGKVIPIESCQLKKELIYKV